jgi:AMP phosphorylase
VRGTSVTAFVTTTSTLLTKGSIGIYAVTNSKLDFSDGQTAEVRDAERPASLDYIKKKMKGSFLTKEETYAIVQDVVEDTLSPAEITAYITASYIHPLNMDEVEFLTRAMVDTGDHLTFTNHPIVDKHSIGGVPGNKISLLVVPIIAVQKPTTVMPCFLKR